MTSAELQPVLNDIFEEKGSVVSDPCDILPHSKTGKASDTGVVSGSMVSALNNLEIHEGSAMQKYKSTIETTQHKVQPIDSQVWCSPVMSNEVKQNMIERAQAILFQCEVHVLVEYVECVIPLMYALYMIILFQLPIVKYYPDTADMT